MKVSAFGLLFLNVIFLTSSAAFANNCDHGSHLESESRCEEIQSDQCKWDHGTCISLSDFHPAPVIFNPIRGNESTCEATAENFLESWYRNDRHSPRKITFTSVHVDRAGGEVTYQADDGAAVSVRVSDCGIVGSFAP